MGGRAPPPNNLHKYAPPPPPVLQGIVLGPVLFWLYKNEEIKSEIRLFAVDCVCPRAIHSENDRKTLQNDLDTRQMGPYGVWDSKLHMPEPNAIKQFYS